MKSTPRSKRRSRAICADRSSERGNALYIILLGVFLFVALMFVFTKSARQGAGIMGQREAQIAADDILTFAQQVQRGVDHVYAQDCSENQISFDQSYDTGYTNANAPADKHCHVFDPNGGSIAYLTVPSSANDGSPWIFTGSNAVQNALTGTSAPDLVIILNNVDATLCQQLNKQLKITGSTSESGPISLTKFTGAFTATDQIGSGDGLRAECTSTGSVNRFYSVVLER